MADLGAIPDDAFDEITVEIVIVGPNGEVPVGTETARFFVRPFGFEIFPDNVEMMGGTSLPIKVVLTDGSDPFESVVYDYSMVWETSGEFGLFNGVSKDLTEDTKNSALYEALEEESEGVEAVSVAIYSKLKGETGPVFFEDRINGSIRITNDENKKIFYIANKPISGGNSTQFWINWFVHTVFEFPPVPGAESYKMTIVEHNPLSSFNGATDSWTAGNPNDLTDGSYRLTTARTSGSVPTDLPDASERASNGIANALAYHSTISGLAKVVVTLMP